MSKKSHYFLMLWPWPLTYDLEKLIRSGHYHYQCVYQIWEQSIPWFLSYRVNTIAGGGRLRRKTITSPDPSDTGDINREILASNFFNCHKEVINAPSVPSISRCIHVVYRHKNVWEYQWSNFIYNCMSTFLHYVHCKDVLLDCSAPGGERCESLTWVDEIKSNQNILKRTDREVGRFWLHFTPPTCCWQSPSQLRKPADSTPWEPNTLA